MNALWWWIDRWRKSTAFTDMTLAQQGAYRNLLDEATLRGGALPNIEHVLAKASGDAKSWAKHRGAVMARFELKQDGWHNETLDGVLYQSERRKKKQAEYRARNGNEGGNKSGNGTGNGSGNKPGNKPGSPISGSIDKTPPNPPAARVGSRTRKKRPPKPTRHSSDPWGQQEKTRKMRELIAGGMTREDAEKQVFG